jgi:hypothetical protein
MPILKATTSKNRLALLQCTGFAKRLCSFSAREIPIMLRSRLLQTLRIAKVNASSSVVKRNLGAAGHGHGHDQHHHQHKPAGPYDVPHHPSQPDEAYLFGINPNKPYEYEGFEFITIGTYLICFGILFFGSMTKDHNSFKVRHWLIRCSCHVTSANFGWKLIFSELGPRGGSRT